jgi:hypothetical protein
MKNLFALSKHTASRTPSLRLPIRFRLRSVAAAICAVWLLTWISVPAQASNGLNGVRLNGLWLNSDPESSKIVQLSIDGTKIRLYGLCRSSLCNQGVVRAQGFTSSYDSPVASTLQGKLHRDSEEIVMTISLEGEGRLRVQMLTHFTDGSHRPNHSSVYHFTRLRRPSSQ